MRLKIVFFCPDSHVESVKAALFDVGAGMFGNYDHCSWQCLGRGQFRPNSSATPFIGAEGVIESVEEWRVEVLCEERWIQRAIVALKHAHPYEEPAYEVIRLEDF